MPMQFTVIHTSISFKSHHLCFVHVVPDSARFKAHINARQRLRVISTRCTLIVAEPTYIWKWAFVRLFRVVFLSSKAYLGRNNSMAYCFVDEGIHRYTDATGSG